MARRSSKLPSSYGGLVRYFDEYRSKIVIKPEHVIIFTLFVIIVGLGLNLMK